MIIFYMFAMASVKKEKIISEGDKYNEFDLLKQL